MIHNAIFSQSNSNKIIDFGVDVLQLSRANNGHSMHCSICCVMETQKMTASRRYQLPQHSELLKLNSLYY